MDKLSLQDANMILSFLENAGPLSNLKTAQTLAQCVQRLRDHLDAHFNPSQPEGGPFGIENPVEE